MSETGEVMKRRKQMFSNIITVFLILNYSFSVPNVVGPPPPPRPEQFIAEIFPNCTTLLHLVQSNVVLTVNATDFPNKMDISFDANYTLFNPNNTTTILIIAPFSLAINITSATFNVKMNDTHLPFDMLSFSKEFANITEINSDFLPFFISLYPITLIMFNSTLLKNTTSVIRWQLTGSISNPFPFEFRDEFFLVYHLATSLAWNGNTTGTVELKVYGKEPAFSQIVQAFLTIHPRVSHIDGGKSFICKWNDLQITSYSIGFVYYSNSYPSIDSWVDLIIRIAYILLIFSPILIVIIVLVILTKRKRKKLHIAKSN